ncbi:MAG: hypothetical protein GX575_25505 [Candidatus Anammoximicrobium sp.]|nr:hypothetical protein [Candidatus Anammoximicrobium sp.]
MAREEASSHSDSEASLQIDLRNPVLAALLAWLWPGAGHLYQRRHLKGVLFMVCVLSTYLVGMALGQGRVVYASWEKSDRRWQYLCQVGAGLLALPALVQNRLVRSGREPLFDGLMAPPAVVFENSEDELAGWHEELAGKFDLATLYTMIAGLLNVLAICDAFAGPFVPAPEDEEEDKKKDPDTPPS